MPPLNLSLFVEDNAQQQIISAITRRVAQESGLEISLRLASVRGGVGKMLSELRIYLRDLQRGLGQPDLLIIARDANCKGYTERHHELTLALKEYKGKTILAIPDPHIERWLLIDSAAFGEAVGKGCSAPDHKCIKDRYKNLLASAVREAGIEPLLGGIEHAEAIIEVMDLKRASQADKSFERFVEELRRVFHHWSEEG